jgi:hypothetical protein
LNPFKVILNRKSMVSLTVNSLINNC